MNPQNDFFSGSDVAIVSEYAGPSTSGIRAAFICCIIFAWILLHSPP